MAWWIPSPRSSGTKPRRARKFREYDKLFKTFTHTEEVIPGSSLSVDDIYDMGGEHFATCEIDAREVAGFVDYIQTLDVLLLKVYDPAGALVLTEVAIILPDYNQVYGSFCQWDRAYKNRSPGMYACLLASRWTQRNGLRYYNLGPVGDYNYKSLFVTTLEPIYSLALTDPEHPLALDPTSPLHTDFKVEHWNKIYRTVTQSKKQVGAR
jgi:arginyl-tRNA--protein-N-Asp/Glu arginylyltransferase